MVRQPTLNSIEQELRDQWRDYSYLVITEQQLPSDLLTLALTLAKMAVQQDRSIANQETVLKLLLNRLFSLTSCQPKISFSLIEKS